MLWEAAREMRRERGRRVNCMMKEDTTLNFESIGSYKRSEIWRD